MISANKIKELKALHLSKVRKELDCFIAEGAKVVEEFLRSDFQIKEIFALEDWILQNKEILEHKKITFYEITQSELERFSLFKNPNQVFAIIQNPKKQLFNLNIAKAELVIALDKIQDPGNMGTIIRIADWFGIHHILCSPDCVDVFSPKVVQSTMGSLKRVAIYVQDLNELLVYTSKIEIYGALLNGENLYQKKLKNKGVLLMGNESKGISDELQKTINQAISIPAFEQNHAESLNVAVATAVICAEFRRQYKMD